ncbi:MAG: heavy metal-responsive transcriptional regulator [Deltaproteobacteria bacterium]|nr:heavy metal-responsive transcriptional regulator [Deltaproteobacteria bacterium]
MGLTIGQVAKECGVDVETIRFYERDGLIRQPARPDSGFRRYPPDVVKRILFVRRAKALGFSLREIRDLLSLRVDSATTCDEVKKRAEEKIIDIKNKIRSLQEMKHALEKLTAACRGRGPTAECPILEALEDGNDAGTPKGTPEQYPGKQAATKG